MKIRLESFTGQTAHPYLSDLARLRMEVFREFPYLYSGDMAYEEAYLQKFLTAPNSVMVIAFDEEQVVGASTGMPLEHETENIQHPWHQRGYELSTIFYFGESVLQKDYRGKGIGVRFFEAREKWARELGPFERLTFCAVIRPKTHPLRPARYVPLHEFWSRRGFVKAEGMHCSMDWKDLDASGETSKSLQFWQKLL